MPQLYYLAGGCALPTFQKFFGGLESPARHEATRLLKATPPRRPGTRIYRAVREIAHEIVCPHDQAQVPSRLHQLALALSMGAFVALLTLVLRRPAGYGLADGDQDGNGSAS